MLSCRRHTLCTSWFLECRLLEGLLWSSAAQLLIALTDLSHDAQEWCVLITLEGQNQARQLNEVSKRQSACDGHLAAHYASGQLV